MDTSDLFECSTCKLPKQLAEFATYTTRKGEIRYRRVCRACQTESKRLWHAPKTGVRRGKYNKGDSPYTAVKTDPDFIAYLNTPPMQELKAQHRIAVILCNRYRLDYRALWKFMTRQWTNHWTRLKGCAPYADLLPDVDDVEMLA